MMLLPMVAGAQLHVEINGICYALYSNWAVVISKDDGSFYSGSVVIPSSVTYQTTNYNPAKNYSVTSIETNAFAYCSGLISVTIPNSVTSIGNYAFRDCYSLNSITIPNSVTNIGKNAFSGTGWYNNQADGLLYLDNWLIGYKGEKPTGELVIAEGTKGIAGAFSDCTSLTVVTIPNSVTNIGEYAFEFCTGLTSVTIPNSVTSIGDNAFKSCRGMTSVTIPNSVTSIGEAAFMDCSDLNSVTIPNSVTSIKRSTFMDCSDLNSVTIPNSVTSIGENSFYGCSGLNSVNIPNSVTSIGNLAFSGCPNLISVTVGMKTPFSIDNNVFSNLTNATLYVPAGSRDAYLNAYIWKNFKVIIEMGGVITISPAGISTFCSTYPLDFSSTDGIKAYIVSQFKPSTGEVTLTRITDVPANTGIVVKGDAGTYTIPLGSGETVVANLLVGVTENTVLNKVDGDYTNYILANKNGSLGFYAVTDGSTLSAGKAYLPLPTAQLPSTARPMKMIFSDDEATNIEQTVSNGEQRGEYYDLQGRRVAKPAHGLYIVNGKKVIFK